MFIITMVSVSYISCGDDDDSPQKTDPYDNSQQKESFISLKGKQLEDITCDASQTTKYINGFTSLSGFLATSTASWCQAEIAESSIKISIQENTSYEDRNATVTITQSKDNSSTSFKIYQTQNSAILIEKESYEVPEGGATLNIDIKSNVVYSVDLNGAEWIKYTPDNTSRGLTSSTIKLEIEANDTGESRKAVVKIKSEKGDASKDIIIVQTSTPVTISPTTVTMFYDDTKQLSAPRATSWSSSNDFVAAVDENGLVKARHIGTTEITASRGKSKAVCSVTIKPMYSLHDNLNLSWGVSRDVIKTIETHKLDEETSEGNLVYDYSFDSNKCYAIYGFKENKLVSVLVMMPFTKALLLQTGYYLLERYQPYYYKGYDYYEIDAMNEKDAKTIVHHNMKTSGRTTIDLFYYDFNALGSSNSRRYSPEIDEEINGIRKKYINM